MAKKTTRVAVNRRTVKRELEQFPYVTAVSDLLIEKGNPKSTLFDLRDELYQCLGVVQEMISRYGETVRLTDDKMPPIA